MDNQLSTNLKNIKSLDPKKREAAVAGLALSETIEALAALEKTAVEDTNIEVQFQAKRALETLRTKLTGESSKAGSSKDEDSENTACTAEKSECNPSRKKIRSKSTPISDDEKIKAIKAAAATNSPETLQSLIRDLETEESAEVRGTALLAIGLLGGTDQLQIFAHHLGDKDPSVRLNCVKALTYMNEKMAYPLFVVALNDSNAKVASRAYGFIRKLGKENIIGLLNKMASSKQLWMRRAAAKAAGKFSVPEVMSVLRQLASDNKGNIRDAALRSIKAITERQNRDSDTDEVSESDLIMSTKSAAEREILKADKSIGFIISRDNDSPLNSDSVMTRMEALQDIINEGDPAGLPEVIARLAIETDNKLKATILIIIGQLGEESDLSHVVPYLRHKDSRIRATAVEVAGMMNPENIVDLLSPFLDDDDNRTTANAVVAIGREPSVNIIPALKRLASSSNPNYKKSCIYAIAQLEDKRLLEILRTLSKDPDNEVADQACDAISMICRSVDNSSEPIDPEENGERTESHENKPEESTTTEESRGTEENRATEESGGTEGNNVTEDKAALTEKNSPEPVAEKKLKVRKRTALKKSRMQRPSMPSQFDLNQTNYRHLELSAIDVIYACYYAYASASLIAVTLFPLVYITADNQTLFYVEMAIAFTIAIGYVVAAVSLQEGKEWSRQFLLFTTRFIRIPILAPKAAKILSHEDTVDLFANDGTNEMAGKAVIAFAGMLLIILMILLVL
jgi:HEAT repeat protein